MNPYIKTFDKGAIGYFHPSVFSRLEWGAVVENNLGCNLWKRLLVSFCQLNRNHVQLYNSERAGYLQYLLRQFITPNTVCCGYLAWKQ